MRKPIEVLSFLVIYLSLVDCYYLHLTDNGPVVLGATITFRAELFDDYRQPLTGTYCFKWRDNCIPPHTGSSEGYSTVSTWNVTYPKSGFGPGMYEVEVKVDRCAFIFWTIISARQFFNVTLMLNGDMNLIQENRTLSTADDTYISSESPLVHRVSLAEPDRLFLERNATSVVSYWFIDCTYYGMSTDGTFSINYTGQSGQKKHVEVLVIASFDNDTDVTTTTTAAPTSTTTPVTTTEGNVTMLVVTTPSTDGNISTPPVPNTTTVVSLPTTAADIARGNFSADRPGNEIKSNDLSSAVHAGGVRTVRVAEQSSLLVKGQNYSANPKLPYVCINSSSVIPLDPNKTYGYFQRTIKIRDPVENVSFTGTNWLKQGEMLNIGVSCNGSAPFRNCVQMYPGQYNVTGKEKCENEQVLPDCRFSIIHYFKSAETYTLVIIIGNEVSRKITPVAVNIYEVTKHPQLSVIIVPVACSAAAVILIVFGIAYYIQSRNRYTIEVADFDFAQASDMEYKTFRERLREAMSNAVNRTQDYVEEGNVWSPSRKYGSMQ